MLFFSFFWHLPRRFSLEPSLYVSRECLQRRFCLEPSLYVWRVSLQRRFSLEPSLYVSVIVSSRALSFSSLTFHTLIFFFHSPSLQFPSHYSFHEFALPSHSPPRHISLPHQLLLREPAERRRCDTASQQIGDAATPWANPIANTPPRANPFARACHCEPTLPWASAPHHERAPLQANPTLSERTQLWVSAHHCDPTPPWASTPHRDPTPSWASATACERHCEQATQRVVTTPPWPASCAPRCLRADNALAPPTMPLLQLWMKMFIFLRACWWEVYYF